MATCMCFLGKVNEKHPEIFGLPMRPRRSRAIRKAVTLTPTDCLKDGSALLPGCHEKLGIYNDAMDR